MGVQLEALIETESERTDPKHTHIIERGEDGRDANVIILEARVNGTPVTALCGYVFVPSRDPERYPPCSKCVEIFEFAADLRS